MFWRVWYPLMVSYMRYRYSTESVLIITVLPTRVSELSFEIVSFPSDILMYITDSSRVDEWVCAAVALRVECQLAVCCPLTLLLYCFVRHTAVSGAALGLRTAVHGFVQAISRCHFEETDPESDELVLMKVRHPCK